MADSLAVVVAAAGTGSRMGGKIKKQFLLLNSKPVLYYSLNIFEAMNLIDEVVLVAHPQEL
ncbi:MAG: 2-C-methyl-D-erythritol 4-phosphate cytidylyltransferase, partial [Syntrophomonadaceae bacterium]